MSENTVKGQLEGEAREKALGRFFEQLEQWSLKMPPVEPIVLDFGLGDFEGTGLIEYWIANEMEAGYCGKYLFLFDGQECPYHSHYKKHETFFVVKGKVAMNIDGKNQTMEQGDVLVMPPGRAHSFAGVGNTLIMEASMPSLVSDNKYDDPRLDEWVKKNLS